MERKFRHNERLGRATVRDTNYELRTARDHCRGFDDQFVFCARDDRRFAVHPHLAHLWPLEVEIERREICSHFHPDSRHPGGSVCTGVNDQVEIVVRAVLSAVAERWEHRVAQLGCTADADNWLRRHCRRWCSGRSVIDRYVEWAESAAHATIAMSAIDRKITRDAAVSISAYFPLSFFADGQS